MAKKKEEKQKKDDPNGVLVPAGLLIGIGLGFLLGNLVAYTLIGLGVGFLAMWLASKKK